jgi:hypothetical protein
MIKAKINGYVRELETEEELVELVRQGAIQPYHPVYLPRMARWAHVEEIPELYRPMVEAQERLLAEEEARRRSPWRRLLSLFGR